MADEAAIAVPVRVEGRAGESKWRCQTAEAGGACLDCNPYGNRCLQQMRPTVRDMP